MSGPEQGRTDYRFLFECGHSATILADEYGDGSAWCQACGDFRCYEDAPEQGRDVNLYRGADGRLHWDPDPWPVIDWLAANMPRALELCPYKVTRKEAVLSTPEQGRTPHDAEWLEYDDETRLASEDARRRAAAFEQWSQGGGSPKATWEITRGEAAFVFAQLRAPRPSLAGTDAETLARTAEIRGALNMLGANYYSQPVLLAARDKAHEQLSGLVALVEQLRARLEREQRAADVESGMLTRRYQAAEALLARYRQVAEDARALYEQVEMDESVGVCLSDRVASLRLGDSLAALASGGADE